MLGFTYYTPTKVAFGKGSVEKVGELMKQFGVIMQKFQANANIYYLYRSINRRLFYLR